MAGGQSPGSGRWGGVWSTTIYYSQSLHQQSEVCNSTPTQGGHQHSSTQALRDNKTKVGPAANQARTGLLPTINLAESVRKAERILCIVCVSSFPRWRLQLIQYGRWNDIKVYPLFMTFSNKEEPKVQLSLELKLSVIGWVIWVISLSLLENKKMK